MTLRVLHVAAVEYSVRTLLLPQLRWLRNAGYDVRVACTPDSRAGFHPDLDPYEPISVRIPRSPSLETLRGLTTLRRAISTVSPDIVHVHSPAAALLLRLLPRRHIEAEHIVYTVHGFPFLWDASDARSRVLQALEKRQSSSTDLMLFQSREDFDRARAAGFRTELVYLGNGIGDEWFESHWRARHSTDTVRFAFLGRLVREKGLMVLLEALLRVPAAHLSIIGDELASERDGVSHEAQAFVREHGLEDRVGFYGFRTGDDLRQLLAMSSALVLPSFREGVPRSVIEAMSLGLPIIASDIRGCRELVVHGHNGFLVQPGSVDALASSMEQIATSSAEEWWAWSRAAEQRAQTHRETDVFERLHKAYAMLGTPAL